MWHVVDSSSQQSWLLDSACSNHMTQLQQVNSVYKGTAKIGNKTRLAITGKGTVQIQTDERMKYIDDVILVPEICKNLLSVC